MTIYEAMRLAPGAASARLLAACARVDATARRQVEVHYRRQEPVLPIPVPMPDLPVMPSPHETMMVLLTEHQLAKWFERFSPSPTAVTAIHRDGIDPQNAEAKLLPDALLSATEQAEAWASACETITEDYIALVAATRDAALRAAEAPLAILLALPAPAPMRRRKMEVPR